MLNALRGTNAANAAIAQAAGYLRTGARITACGGISSDGMIQRSSHPRPAFAECSMPALPPGRTSALGSTPRRTPSRKQSTRTLSTQERVVAFNERVVEATRDIAAAFKPNTAFYEALGAAGWEALRQTVDHIHRVAPEIPVILDAKRADIGSTNEGYVRAIFDEVGSRRRDRPPLPRRARPAPLPRPLRRWGVRPGAHVQPRSGRIPETCSSTDCRSTGRWRGAWPATGRRRHGSGSSSAPRTRVNSMKSALTSRPRCRSSYRESALRAATCRPRYEPTVRPAAARS